ncbi:MAG: PqqD family protein [Clostridia bacterium]|nr:PqqD family protein [Clostridia bacterium]
MKLKESFIKYNTGSEQIMVSGDGDFNGMVRSNRTAAFIIDLLSRDITRDGIISAMLEKYDAPRDMIERDVDKILLALRGIGAIDE